MVGSQVGLPNVPEVGNSVIRNLPLQKWRLQTLQSEQRSVEELHKLLHLDMYDNNGGLEMS
jgi:hypothetical protein